MAPNRRGITVASLAALALLAASASARAADLRVPQEFATIAEAAAEAQPGDRIVVTGGTHADVSLSAPGASLVGRGGAVLEGTTRIVADDASVGGFTIRGALAVTGDRAAVERNRMQGSAILISGLDASVRRNRSRSLPDGAPFAGIRVRGDGARVEGNRLAVVGTGVWVVGGGAVVSGNAVASANAVVTGSGPSVPAIEVDVEGAGPRIERNRIRHVDAFGIVVRGDGATVSRNRTKGLVSPRDAIHVAGGGALVARNRISHAPDAEPGGNGIVLLGHGNAVRENVVRGAVADGIQVWLGTGNLVEDCRVVGAGRCGVWVHADAADSRLARVETEDCRVGLLNTAPGTVVEDSTFEGSGEIDVFFRETFELFEGNEFGTYSGDLADDPGFPD